VASERFIDGIVDKLLHHVVEARAIFGITNVHAGPLANRIQTFQYFNAIGVVAVIFRH
jgi:hypothetical protein